MQASNLLLIDGILKEEIRIALLDEHNKLIEYYVTHNNSSIIGNVYLGKIEKIDYALEAIFLSFNQTCVGFLPFNEISRSHSKYKLKKNGYIVIQVVRDKTYNKHYFVTNYVALSGKNCVLLPNTSNSSGISRKITGTQRKNFKEFLKQFNGSSSLIIRTSSAHAKSEEIEDDYKNLSLVWDQIQHLATNKSNHLLYYDDEFLRILRKHSSSHVKSFSIAGKDIYSQIMEYKQKQLITLPKQITYDDTCFQFLEPQIKKLYDFEAPLPSGGGIVISHTEALIAIDVNTKTSSKENNLELTALKTNLEAVEIIYEHILLRNLSGIIIIDFIDLHDPENSKRIDDELKRIFKKDKAENTILKMNEFGVVQISRQRIYPSFVSQNFNKCVACDGFGYTKSLNTHTYALMRELMKYKTDTCLKIHTTSEIMVNLLNHYSTLILTFKHLSWEQIAKSDQSCICTSNL